MKHFWMMTVLVLAACQQQPAPGSTSPQTRPVAADSTDDITTARTFLTRVYAGYHPDAPLNAALPDDQVYAPPLLAAMAANSAAYDGEVGYLDSDPLCECQDTAQDLRALAFDITPLGDGQLRAVAPLAGADEPLTLDLTLSREKGEWRVADIATARAPSLLQALERDTGNVSK